MFQFMWPNYHMKSFVNTIRQILRNPKYVSKVIAQMNMNHTSVLESERENNKWYAAIDGKQTFKLFLKVIDFCKSNK